MKKYLLGILFLFPVVVSASSLTISQVQAVVGLLEAFKVNATIIQNVEDQLYGVTEETITEPTSTITWMTDPNGPQNWAPASVAQQPIIPTCNQEAQSIEDTGVPGSIKGALLQQVAELNEGETINGSLLPGVTACQPQTDSTSN